MAAVSASKIITKAKSFVGTSDDGNNNVMFNTDYYGREVSGDDYPWCAVFVWDVFRLCGASSIYYGGGKCAYTPTLANFYKNQGRWYDSPEPGDLVFFKWAGSSRICHVGIVMEVNSDSEITTIEGNTSTSNNSNGGSVMIRRRNFRYIEGFARPDYLTDYSNDDNDYTNSSEPSNDNSCYDRYTGNSCRVDEVFAAIGVPEEYRGNYNNRRAVAEANGIGDYEGTADQNNRLIELATCGELRKVGYEAPEENNSNNSGSSVCYPRYTGGSYRVDEVFESIGVPEEYRGNYRNRKAVAEANGIGDYEGTAEQNNRLIELAKNGDLVSPDGNIESGSSNDSSDCYDRYDGGSYRVDEVFESIGVPEEYRGNYRNRKAVAEANGIDNYEGTAEQNTTLVELAKNGELRRP